MIENLVAREADPQSAGLRIDGATQQNEFAVTVAPAPLPGLIAGKLEEEGLLDQVELHVIENGGSGSHERPVAELCGLAVQPTLRVAPGTRVHVLVTRDLVFR
ncbi:MAG: hypothetical protein B7Z22_01350 [Hyphomonas sp. 32-62-5]|nr:MAG: hypothetical protein B7Z22_01350 [Hyphomonas sp. 32-62-5]